MAPWLVDPRRLPAGAGLGDGAGEKDGPLFCPVDAAGRVRVSRLGGESGHYVLRKRQRVAGLSGITPHDFRRGMVSRLLEAGVDVFTVQQLAGHADAVTTARYERRGEEARRAAARLRDLAALIDRSRLRGRRGWRLRVASRRPPARPLRAEASRPRHDP